MDNSNPLHFFISCADKPIQTGLPDDAGDFMSQFDQLAADLQPIANKERVVWSSDEIDVEYRPEQSYWTNTSSPAIKYNPFDGETSKALEGVDNIIVNLPNIGVAFAKLTEFINTMDNVISRVNNFPKTKTHSEIAEASTNLKAELTERKKRLLHGKLEKAPNATKIKWLGQINVLGTLFYHLHKGQDGGEPYISGTVEQVKHMLLDNFVDSDGHDLSKATLDTIFMPSRSEKRAKEGDRIELPNKKVKK